MGAFLLLTSGLLLFFVTPGTNQFAITIINMIMGGAFLATGIVLASRGSRHTFTKEDQ
jgi:hypothetical protein